ncbi:hypothetical protein D2E64_00590 [Mycobacteroides abscessus]|nr:hypothetical protein [Mycobacteroides abscessus]AWG48860.1 hypothetical protein DDT48_05230 [Mycobacteroides abscessus]OLT94824.1 hypothetical protein BKG58_00560 [Mycobacteroides abscessus subsp. abscessus]PVA22318.1 hypothetical protein DDJ61_01195 [Mycobacteroides abscessus]PVA31590.1 hypothetical protein DDJ98_19285 [Mycobacteroides abscessus]PVA87069.1 hypothetical protein DDJ76_10915 [Mycobacteroides abscessus]
MTRPSIDPVSAGAGGRSRPWKSGSVLANSGGEDTFQNVELHIDYLIELVNAPLLRGPFVENLQHPKDEVPLYIFRQIAPPHTDTRQHEFLHPRSKYSDTGRSLAGEDETGRTCRPRMVQTPAPQTSGNALDAA